MRNVRILDLSRVLSGPFCSRMLADMGADVIKIESTGGDAMRYYPPFKGPYSAYFTQWNAGKKSVCINLNKKAGIDVVKKLVACCDVVLQNFRTGVLEQMGLGYDELRKINSRIILCSISGFGQTGSEAKRIAYTDIVQAYSGLDYIAARMKGDDADPPGFPVSFADTCASLNACISILAALYHRELTGQGQSIDISMLDCLLASNDSTLQPYIFSDGDWDKPVGIWRPPLRMKDGHMAVALLLKFDRTVRAIGRPELLQDERFNTMAAQVIHINDFLDIMGEWAKEVSVDEAAAIFEKYDIPYAKVNSNREILNSQVVKDRQMLAGVDLPGAGQVPVINTPFKFSAVSTGPAGPPPRLGQNNEEVLKNLAGFSESEIADMKKNGIIKEQK